MTADRTGPRKIALACPLEPPSEHAPVFVKDIRPRPSMRGVKMKTRVVPPLSGADFRPRLFCTSLDFVRAEAGSSHRSLAACPARECWVDLRDTGRGILEICVCDEVPIEVEG